MSKQWTPELQSIVLQGVFEECNISFGKALCEKIAARVRAAGIDGFTECTPKAVENQLYKWKKKNTSTAAASASPAAGTGAAGASSVPGSPSVSKKAAPKTSKTPKTPRAKKGAAGKKATTPEGEEGEKEVMSPSPTKGCKRGTKGEGREEGGAKKVKTESVMPERVEEEEEV